MAYRGAYNAQCGPPPLAGTYVRYCLGSRRRRIICAAVGEGFGIDWIDAELLDERGKHELWKGGPAWRSRSLIIIIPGNDG